MFVDIDDFNLVPYTIPDPVPSNFQAFVDAEEENILRKLLGNRLYDSFIAGIAEDYPDDKWLDLRDGAMYNGDERDNELKWEGMNTMLKPYILYRWVYAGDEELSTVGMTRQKVENSNRISARNNVSINYASFSKNAGVNQNKLNSLYGFLYKKKDTDYPTWIWTNPGTINRFDL